LPEPEELAALEAAAASAYGAPDPGIATSLPGTQMLISLLPTLFPQNQVAVLGPTYNEYARAFARAGSKVVDVQGLAELEKAPCAILCNPNNPDGRRFAAADLLALIEARRGEGLLLVDESFADLEEEGLSLVPHLPQPGLVILRSLSKSYGLGGLRLGFALAAPELAAAIRSALGPWPVSGPAIEIGKTALSDRDWLASTKERLQGDAKRLDAILEEAGLAPAGGTLLFRLAASENAEAIFMRLGEAGILVRRFGRCPNWLRFGIPGSKEDWERLAEALA
jgi:cobalamin biosynthetic protein CobC